MLKQGSACVCSAGAEVVQCRCVCSAVQVLKWCSASVCAGQCRCVCSAVLKWCSVGAEMVQCRCVCSAVQC